MSRHVKMKGNSPAARNKHVIEFLIFILLLMLVVASGMYLGAKFHD